MAAPAQTAVGVVSGNLGPGSAAVVPVDLDEQAVVAVLVREVKVVVVTNRDVPARQIEGGRCQSDATAVNIGIPRFVLREPTLPTAVGIGRGVVFPTWIVDGHPPFPVTAARTEILRNPPLIGLEIVVVDRDDFSDDCGKRTGRRVCRLIDGARNAARRAEVVFRRVAATSGRKCCLVVVAAKMRQ